MKKIIATDKAPAAIGPYSQAVDCGSFLVTSGQVPFDPATGEFVPGGIAEQTRQVLTNIRGAVPRPQRGRGRCPPARRAGGDRDHLRQIKHLHSCPRRDAPRAAIVSQSSRRARREKDPIRFLRRRVRRKKHFARASAQRNRPRQTRRLMSGKRSVAGPPLAGQGTKRSESPRIKRDGALPRPFLCDISRCPA